MKIRWLKKVDEQALIENTVEAITCYCDCLVCLCECNKAPFCFCNCLKLG